MRVAVIGASGIGKQHAKWFHLEGCDVVAFTGTSTESVEKTTQVLKKLFDFTGHAYTDVAAMLKETSPDIAVVSSPPSLHLEHSLLALEAGCHLYCEKPLVWFGKGTVEPHESLLRDAAQVRDESRRRGLTFALNTQYVAAVPDYHSFMGTAFEECLYPETMFMRMESKNPVGQKEYESIWTDLSPHPISMLMEWCPAGIVDEDSVSFTVERCRNRCKFDFVSPEGKATQVEFDLGQIQEGAPERAFGVNGRIACYEGRNDADGVYRSYLRCGDQEIITEDFVQVSVRAFIHSIDDPSAEPLVTGDEGLRNLEIQLQLLERAARV
ncbi:MAG: hypothetical protein AUJ92_05695 [Armatimonadetes bacterium CG2_30_59_28]|nr:Gfo/Idh/MocA family oxidoreductase [Armatimonadota bacterium]OIO96577.1 MAG: hypothetical protein AUJ92_05695 [Armatimonadetes bacterium CG2_30_59_28]PIU61475.1 MAG: hypothetical protein COS85_20885 [Armatimonadetes bacterium CG07_land_8_20_14_0_80_59_28]PIX42796.1 MAG: hypothetical protein COZ56_08460 [Armatimonadetes bacterium CG_4_8_14_3_um_filter_58_9]